MKPQPNYADIKKCLYVAIAERNGSPELVRGYLTRTQDKVCKGDYNKACRVISLGFQDYWHHLFNDAPHIVINQPDITPMFVQFFTEYLN